MPGTAPAEPPITGMPLSARSSAGLTDGEGRPLVTFHGLRHSCASIQLGAGVPLIVVSRHLGHANPNITATVYAHLFSDKQLHDAVAIFDGPTPNTVGDAVGEIRTG